MGVSAIHLAAALHDMGSGQLIGTEIEPLKAARARENIAAAGLSEFIDIRIGDARETLRDIAGDVNMVLLDGAFTLYLDVLKLLEPPANGFRSMPILLNTEGRGNELTVVTRYVP